MFLLVKRGFQISNSLYTYLTSLNDLGVIFDSKLSFRGHISQKINKAYSIRHYQKKFYLYV